MTELGWLHLLSALFLSLVICFAVSLNEQREPRLVVRETARRWLKFIGVAIALGIVVSVLD